MEYSGLKDGLVQVRNMMAVTRTGVLHEQCFRVPDPARHGVTLKNCLGWVGDVLEPQIDALIRSL